jgi:hypothetical protein
LVLPFAVDWVATVDSEAKRGNAATTGGEAKFWIAGDVPNESY